VGNYDMGRSAVMCRGLSLSWAVITLVYVFCCTMAVFCCNAGTGSDQFGRGASRPNMHGHCRPGLHTHLWTHQDWWAQVSAINSLLDVTNGQIQCCVLLLEYLLQNDMLPTSFSLRALSLLIFSQ